MVLSKNNDKLEVKKTICCLIEKKNEEFIESMGVIKLNKTKNKNSPKKKKNIQNKNNKYEVALDVIIV